MNRDEIISILIIILIVSVGSYLVFQNNNKDSVSFFIQKCNDIHGKDNWQISRLSEWTTYSNEFWDTYPRAYIGNPMNIELDVETYSCFRKP